jgi:hypothetical protein
MQLVDKETRKPINPGDKAKTFRGDDVVVTEIIKPHTPASSGRVSLKNLSDGLAALYYPSVINAEWEGRDD